MDLFSLFGASHLGGTMELWEITIQTMLTSVGIKLFSNKKKKKLLILLTGLPFLDILLECSKSCHILWNKKKIMRTLKPPYSNVHVHAYM